MDIIKEAIENWHDIRRHAYRAYSVSAIHEDYENALIMAEWALYSAKEMEG